MGDGSNREDLEEVTYENDLGVKFQNDLHFNQHITEKVQLANRNLGLIARTFKYLDDDMMKTLYKALVRPHLEYASTVWSPYKMKEKKLIEGVQRRATKLLPYLRNKPYDERLRHLGLPTLEYRRYRSDLIQVYKLLHGIDNADYRIFFKKSTTQLRGHNQKLFQRQNKLLTRKMTFSQRVVPHWNKLPEAAVNAQSVNSFKFQLNLHTKDLDWKFCPSWY